MRIGIEAQRIFRKKKGGMDVAAIEIIKSLQKVDQKNEYIIYSASDDDADIVQESENFKIKFLKGLSYIDWEQVWLPLQAKKDKVDLLHCTSNTAPLWGDLPLVVTVHDLIYLEENTWASNKNLYQQFGNQYRKQIVPSVVRMADQVITVSEFEKANIINSLKLNAGKIEVVSNGVNSVFRKINHPNLLNQVRKKYQLPERFILYMGNTEPRKNMSNMLKAYSILLSKVSHAPNLVITNVNQELIGKHLAELKIEKIKSKINLTGYAAFADLPFLYNLSDFFVYPSLREGFGLPIIEAMACGTAVITSNVSSMPEIAGDAALLIDPTNPENISDAMIKYLLNSDMKNKMIQRGEHRYQLYTWDASARKLMDIYDAVLMRQFSKTAVVNLNSM